MALDDLQRDIYQQKRREYRDKTISDLEAIVVRNAVKIQTQTGANAIVAMAELEAAKDIIQEKRKEEDEQAFIEVSIFDAIDLWQKEFSARRDSAILNLPTAVSYNGQLVMAVLAEESSMTIEKICQWIEGICSMDSNEINDVLKALIEEELVEKNENGTYSLLTICDDTLYRHDVLKWAEKKYQRKYGTSMRPDQIKFLTALVERKTPLTEEDFIGMTRFGKDSTSYKLNRTNPKKWSSETTLSSLRKCGILMSMPVPDTKFNLHYFPLIGEE